MLIGKILVINSKKTANFKRGFSINFKPTLQSTLALTILMLGIVGLVLVLSADYTYRKLTIQHQSDALSILASIKSEDLIKKLSSHHNELGFRLQSEKGFNNAFQIKDKNRLTYWLDEEFNRYFVTIGLLKLEKIIVYDKQFKKVSSSARGLALNNNGNNICDSVIKTFMALPSIEKIKPYSDLCHYDGKPLLTSIMSIGSMIPRGFIQIVSDPAHILANITDELGTPLQIMSPDNILLHQSSNWPDKHYEADYIYFEHTVRTKAGLPALQIKGASDIGSFNQQLQATRIKVITLAVVLILLCLFLALYVLRNGLKPLKNLQIAATNMSIGEFETIDEKGFPEISTPIRSFNKMTSKINTLIIDLQNEVAGHQKTEEELIQAKETAELHAKNAEEQRNFSNMTLQSIVDAVITTNNQGLVTYMNPMAEQLTGWSQSNAINKPITQVMHALQDDTRVRIYDLTENIENKSVLDEPIKAILVDTTSKIETPIEYIAAPMRDSSENIEGIVFIIHDESVQRSLNRQLTFQATHDALTGLINRYEFERKLKEVINTPQTENTHNTLCYLDLDQFKLVNDTCGHTAGDELLKQITMLLQGCVRENDTLARLGGDEFGLLLVDCNLQCAQRITHMMLDTITEYNFAWGDSNFTIGVSIGIVAINATSNSCETILSNADSACYLAKESGRNRTQIYSEEDDLLLTQQREMHWVSRINTALDENRFQLYFQEIKSLKDVDNAAINHGEVLLRMINTEGDIISPSSFMPSAERYNMIEAIDKWVVENAILWLAKRKNKILLSVNLSGTSVSNKNFLHYVVSKIQEHNVKPELLCFEITETAAISHLNTAIHFMTALKKLGCTFALDDFGSGLSSFSYLNSLPVDYLKIDGSFVVDIDKDPMHYAMVKSINEVGQVMGINTIAEYVASNNILECLKEIGVDNAQGYVIGRPVPLASVSDEVKPQIGSSSNNVTNINIKN